MLCMLILLSVASCGQTEVLSDVAPLSAEISPNSDGRNDALSIAYRIGQRSRVTAYVEDAAGKRFTLRDSVLRVPNDQPYSLYFDGTVQSAEPPVVQRVLPDGDYAYVIEAVPEAGGAPITQRGQISVRDAASDLPLVEDLHVLPRF